MVIGSGWDPCFAHEVLNALLPLPALHALLKQMHFTFETDVNAFQRDYALNVKEASKYLAQANFEGYALKHGESPSSLHFAAGCGCLDICTQLLQRCKRLNFVTDDAGQTPIFWAVKSGMRSTISLLLHYGADATLKDSKGESLLHVAASLGFPIICNILLNLPAVQLQSLEVRSDRGLTPLHVAAKQGHTEVVRRLLKAAADPLCTTPQGRTPLHLATVANHSEVVDKLLQEGCHDLFDHSDAQGMRALDYALEQGLVDVADPLGNEEVLRAKIKRDWKSFFEPACRASINSRMSETWLEIGRPHVIAIEHQHLRLQCRVADAMGLLKAYDVEAIMSNSDLSLDEDDLGTVQLPGSDSSFTVLSFARAAKQKAADDVEFRLPRCSSKKTVWKFGACCAFRVIGVVSLNEAAGHGYPFDRIRSKWAHPLRLH